jgi:hypothetical protein
MTILQAKIDDWRYRKETSGIMTTLFLTEYGFGMVSASDDIVDLKWIDFIISVITMVSERMLCQSIENFL